MAAILLREEPDTGAKLAMMQEDARFDVADNDEACLPDLSFLRGAVKASPGPPAVPKMFVSNDCAFNCAYCTCRRGNDCRQRYTWEPRQLAALAVKAAQENTHGVFLTSSVFRNADYTQELIVRTLQSIRREWGYRGYVHAKVMPGADPALIEQTGRYADRLSVNIEVADSAGYAHIARDKNRANILGPMGRISTLIRRADEERRPGFATSQTTQLMAGSTGEDDRTILTLAQALYGKYRLKRVYYTAFQYRHPAQEYDMPPVATPRWRMRRLYQADRLMQLYGFEAGEVLSDHAPYLEEDLDPKAAWALRHLDRFPVEVNKAERDELLRVPGIGLVYAARIEKARQYCTVTHDVLRALGVPLRRSGPFITCAGRFRGDGLDNPERLRARLADPKELTEEQLCRRAEEAA